LRTLCLGECEKTVPDLAALLGGLLNLIGSDFEVVGLEDTGEVEHILNKLENFCLEAHLLKYVMEPAE